MEFNRPAICLQLFTTVFLIFLVNFQKVGCDNIVGSEKVVDRCGVCGGNNKSCNTMKGFYTPPRLPRGYNKIISLPEGACNINITETMASRNILALKKADGTYVFNGRWRRSPPGQYKVSGTVFHYKRHSGKSCVGECIHAKGPLTELMILELLAYDRNPGIFYEYSIPTGMVPKIIDKMKKVDPSRKAHPEPQPHSGVPQRNSHHQNSRHSIRNRTSYLNKFNNTRIINRQPGPHYIPSYDSNQAFGLPGSSSKYPQSKWNPHIRQGHQRTSTHRRYPYSRTFQSRINSSASAREIHGRQYANVQSNRMQNGNSQVHNRPDNRRFPSARPHHNHTRYRVPHRRPILRIPRPVYNQPKPLKPQSFSGNRPVVPNSNTGTSDRKEVTYQWNIVGFTKCSEPCGGGSQVTKIVCVKMNSQMIVTDDNCEPGSKLPTQTTACNTAPCFARWTPEEWSLCSVTCGEGKKTRQVECKQKISPAFSKRVSATACLNQTRLPTVTKCEKKPCAQWEIKDWSKCSVDCGLGQRTRQVNCLGADSRVIPEHKCNGDKPSATEVCDMGSCAKAWFFTEWLTECSAPCGHGVLRRRVHCSADDGSSLPDSKCKLSDKPKSEKSCKSDQPCGGVWFTGPWSECTATCGQAVKARDVTCVKKLHSYTFAVVDPQNCLEEKKPASEEPCVTLPACPPEWHMTDWSQCSASCGTGSKTREVKCVDTNLRHSTFCDPNQRPVTRQSCNSDSCHHKPLNTDPSCRDHMKQCRLVVQARLCSYPYYQRKCCETCHKHRIHHQQHHPS